MLGLFNKSYNERETVAERENRILNEMTEEELELYYEELERLYELQDEEEIEKYIRTGGINAD